MPYKCLRCETIAQNKESQQCGCKTPHFVKCETVHFLHPEGTGRLLSKVKKSVGLPDQQTRVVEQPLSLCCDSQARTPIATQIASQVTCEACLVVVDSLPEPPESLT